MGCVFHFLMVLGLLFRGSFGNDCLSNERASYVGQVLRDPFYTCNNKMSSCAGRCGQFPAVSGACGCDGACLPFGDCCIDYEEICAKRTGLTAGNMSAKLIERTLIGRQKVRQNDTLVLSSMSCKSYDFHNLKSGQAQTVHLRLVHSCPARDGNVERRQLCENPPDELRYKVPVVGTPMLYRNAFCAQCNGDLEYEVFPVVFYSNNSTLAQQAIEKLWLNQTKDLLNEYYKMDYGLVVSTKRHKEMLDMLTLRYKCYPNLEVVPVFSNWNPNAVVRWYASRLYRMPFVLCLNNSQSISVIQEFDNPTQLLLELGEPRFDRVNCLTLQSDENVRRPCAQLCQATFFSLLFDPIRGYQGSVQSNVKFCRLGEILHVASGKCMPYRSCTEAVTGSDEERKKLEFNRCHDEHSLQEAHIKTPRKDPHWTIEIIKDFKTLVFSMELLATTLGLQISDVSYHSHTKADLLLTDLVIPSRAESKFMTLNPTSKDRWLSMGSILGSTVHIHTFNIEEPFQCEDSASLRDFNATVVNSGPDGKLYILDADRDLLFNLDHVQVTFAIRPGETTPWRLISSKACFKESAPCLDHEIPPGSYDLISMDNSSLQLRVNGRTYLNDSQFTIRNNNGSFQVFVCDSLWKDLFVKVLDLHSILVLGGTLLSVVSLVGTITTIQCIQSLKTVPGQIITHLSAMLLTAQTLHSLTQVWGFDDSLCMVMGILQHFLWLCVFGWMAVLAWDLVKTFDDISLTFKSNIFLKYFSFVWCGSLGITGACVAVSILKSQLYGLHKVCWLTDRTAFISAFLVPVSAVILWNIVHFLWVLVKLCSVMSDVRGTSRRTKKDEAIIYFRIFCLLGFNWLLGILATLTGEAILWNAFDVINTLQGFGIFLAVVVKRRVFRLCCLTKTRHPSTSN